MYLINEILKIKKRGVKSILSISYWVSKYLNDFLFFSSAKWGWHSASSVSSVIHSQNRVLIFVWMVELKGAIFFQLSGRKLEKTFMSFCYLKLPEIENGFKIPPFVFCLMACIIRLYKMLDLKKVFKSLEHSSSYSDCQYSK